MCVKCAESDALRSTFPTLLGGLYIQGELDGAADRIVANLSSKHDTFDPKGLVESTSRPPAPQATPPAEAADDGEETDLGPQPPKEKPQEPDTSAKVELEKVVTGSGFTFNHLQKWGMDSGNLDGADSLAGFEEVTEANAKRLLRNKAGLLRALGEVKARMEAK